MRDRTNMSIDLFILKQNLMSQLTRVIKKTAKDQTPEDSRRDYTDHDIFCLEYLNNTMNYLLPGKNDLNHSYRLNSEVLEEIIYEDITNLGILFPEKVKQMKPVCSPALYAKDLQEYGDFINYELPRAHQRQMQSIERQLKRQVQFRLAVKRLRRRYPFVSQHVCLSQGQKLIVRMKKEILQSLMTDNEIADRNIQEHQLEKNKLYRELFNLTQKLHIQKPVQNHRVLDNHSSKNQHNQNNLVESTPHTKPRKGRRPKKALEEKDLQYRPTLNQKIIKKTKLVRSADHNEKPSRIDQQSEHIAENLAVVKQSQPNPLNLPQQKNPGQALQGQLKMQIQADNKDPINFNIIDKQTNQQPAVHQIDNTQQYLKVQLPVVKKRRPRIIKDKISGQSQAEKKSEHSQKLIKKRNYKKNTQPSDVPAVSLVATTHPQPKPEVVQIGIQANPDCLQQEVHNNRILIPKHSSPAPNPSTIPKETDLHYMQEQQPEVDLQQRKSKQIKKKLQQSKPKSEIQSRQLTVPTQPKAEQRVRISNVDDFIDQCLK